VKSRQDRPRSGRFGGERRVAPGDNRVSVFLDRISVEAIYELLPKLIGDYIGLVGLITAIGVITL
jgi:hypothetical protein